MLKKLINNYLNGVDKIIFTDYKKSYYRSEFLTKVNYYKKHLNLKWRNNHKNRGIAILVNRNIDYFAIIFACWLCNGYYVPLTKYISKRNFEYQVKNSLVSLVAIEKKNKIFLKTVRSNLKKKFSNLSYIIFTSGSTGEKKGVKISKKNFESYISSIKKKFVNNFKPKSLLINGEISFDIVNADIAFALLFDSEICISEDSKNIFSFFDILEKRKVESIYAVPSAWNVILYYAISLNKKFSFIKYINSGGEILNLNLYKKLKKIAPNSIIHNFYGPTEFTINSTCCEITKKEILNKSIIDKNNNFSIGKMLPHIKYKIFSNDNKNIGELLLSGNQLMNGYLINNNSNICKINSRKYYMTGDMVERNEQGNLFFLGRNKDFVKFKGYRLNLQQISNIVSKVTGKISFIEVINEKLCAFLENYKKPVHNLKKKLSHYLDYWEIPEQYYLIDQMPKLENGKIDKKKIKKKIK